MRCPHCQSENPETGQFCTCCGTPLTEQAASHAAREQNRLRKKGRTGRFLGGIGKAVCYVMLFFLIQSAVIGFYSMFYTAGEMSGMMGDMMKDGIGGYEEYVYDLSEEVFEAVMEEISLLTLISGAATILFLALFFTLRRKNLFEECDIRPVSFSRLALSALAGSALNVVVAVTISFLPLPQSWFAGLEDQYSYLGEESNIFIAILSTAVITGLVEEIIFRGLAESRMRRGMPGWLSVILSALLFGVCHGTPIAIAYAAVLGVVFSLMNRRCGSILPSVVAHMFFNGATFWFVTEDPLLILALYLICGGVLTASLYFFFRRDPEESDTIEKTTE